MYNANDYVRTVLHSEEQDLFFPKGPVNEGLVFSKVWTWFWFKHVEGFVCAEGLSQSE